MDYDQYQERFFVDPSPRPRYEFVGTFGVTLYYEDFEEAVEFFTQVLGPPAYVEGIGTRGWKIGDGWLTLLKGTRGNPLNVEVSLVMGSIRGAERLHKAIIDAGGSGEEPSDQLMYEPIRYCAAFDPWGVGLLVISPLPVP
jgi:hypothetical protein